MSRKYRFGLPAPGLIAPGLVPALLAGPPTAFVTAARWTMRAGLVAAALGLAIILPTLSAGPAAAQDEGAATSTTPAFATSTPGFAPDSKDKPGPATVIVERCFEDRETGEVTCTESTEPAGVLIEQTTGPRGCYFDDLGDYICYEEVSISDLLMTLDQGGEDAFTVKGSDLLLGYTYELRVKRESGNSNIGFSAVCDGVQVTVEVPAFSANRHSYSHDFTLHGCCPPGGTVTAEVLRNGSVVATREKEVTVLGPEVSISARQSSVTEGDDIMFDVTANPAPKSDLKVDVSVTESGFFITGLRPRSVTIPENGSTASFTVRTRNDRVDESDGSVTASIREDEDELYVVGSPSSKTVTVKDNDVKVSFSSSTYTVNQGSVGAVTVRLSEASDQRLSIPIVVTAGSAESGDYRVTGLTSSGELTFSAGSTSRTFNIVANYDLDDDNETVDLEFDSDDLPYDVMEGTPSSSRVTIIDPDVLVSFEQSSYRVVEGSSVSVKVILSKAPGSSVTISLTRTNQGTTSNSDYSGVPSRVIFNRGDKDESFTFRATQDSVDDDGESVKLGFESLPTGVIVGTPRETTISIIDDDEANLVVDPATLRVDEDGTGTFTVKLATRPTASVTVSVSSGDTDAATVSASSLVFTTSNWNGAKTVTVSGVDDDDATDETVTVSLRASSTDSDYRGKTGSVGVSVIDDDTPNLVVDPATLRVNEDGTGTFTVKLATRPTASVTVSVSSGDTDAATVSASSLVFTTSNWNGAKTVTVSGVDDDDATDETVTVSLRASSTDSDYRGKTGSVGVSVIDDDTPNLVVDPATLRVDEDGTGTFTVKLATRPTASVTVSVSSGDTDAATVSASSLVFTTSNWNGAKTVTVSGVDDDDATDETVTVSLRASSTDSDYRGKTGSVGVSVIDDDTPNLVVDPATLRVNEDGTGTFTVKLATLPTASVTVSVSSGDTDAATVSASSLVFTTSNWNGAKTVTVSGVDDDDATDETVTVSLRASSTDSDYRGKTGSVGVSVIDDDTPNLVVDPATLRVNEDGTGTFTVKLATLPTASVTVSVSSGDTDAATVSASSLVFTTSNWNGAKTVTVSGVDDDDATDETVTVSLRASSTDSDYRGKTGSVGVSVIDDDTPNLVVDPATLRVDEDGTGTFTVKLATRPTASVTVSVSSGDTDAATVSASSLVFTTSNWNGAKTVTVSGVDDDDATDETVTVSLRASSTDSDYRGKTGSVRVSVIDDDTPNLVVDPATLRVNEDGTGTFTVNLAARPTGSVTVSLSSGDARAASVSPLSLSFSTSNWTRAQTVTVSGVNDADVANEEVEVELEASGGGYGDATASVTVNVEDDDASLVLSEDSLDIGEAGSGTFTVNLAARPTGSVTVSLSSGDARAASVSPSSLSFSTSNWTRAQTVTVSGVNDADVANEEVEVELEASGGGYGDATASVTVNVEDDDASLVLSEDSLDIGEAGSGTFTVNLAARPTGSVTVSLSSGDARAASVSPSSLSFSTSNWTRAQTVTVSGVNDADVANEEVEVELEASGGGYGDATASVTVNVEDDDASLVLSEDSLDIGEAGSGTFTVNLAARPTGSVTVSLSSGDARAASVSPSSLSFSTSNWTRAQTVTVSGVNDADVRDEEVTVSLSATGGGYGGKTASVTVNVTDGEIQFPVLSEPGLEVDEADRKKIVATSTLPDPNFYYRVSLLRSEDGVTYEVEPGFEHDPASTTEFEAEFSPNRPGLYKVELRACRDADRTICAHVESSKHLTKLEAPDNLDVRPLPPDGRQGKAGLSWTGDATATMYVVEVKWDGQEWTAPIRNFTTSSIVMMAEYDITLDEISGLKVRDQGRDSDFNYDHGLSVAPYAYTFHVRAKGSGDILDSNDSAPVTIIDTPILSANGTSPMDGPGEVLVKWRKPGGATGYKIRWRELGADTDGNLHDSEGKLSETEAQADELWLLDPSSVPADYDDDEDIDDPSIDQYRIEGLGLYEIYGVQLNYTTTEGWVFSAQDFYVWPSDRPAGHGETVATYPLKNYLKDATYTYYICDKSFPSRHGDWIRLINHAMDHWVDATDGLVQMVHQDGDMPEGSGICADFSGYVNHIVSMYNKLSPEEAEATTTKGFVMGVLSTMHDLGMRRMEQLTANEILMADDVSTSSKVTNFPEISREVARGTCIKRGDSKADACVTTTAVFEEGNLKFSVALRNVFAFKDNDRRKLGLRDTDIEFYSDILLARSFYEKVLNEFQEGSATEPLPRPGDLPHDVRLVDSEAKVCPTIYQALIHEAGHAMGVSFRLNTVPGDSTHSAKTIGPTVMRRTACTTAPFDVLAIYALYQTYGRTE